MKDSKNIYNDEKIKLSFLGEAAFRKFVIIVHIIIPLKFLMLGFILGILCVGVVAFLNYPLYIVAVIPFVLSIALYGYRNYIK